MAERFYEEEHRDDGQQAASLAVSLAKARREGYADGESNVAADWTLALTEELGDAFEVTPSKVADEIRRLQGNAMVRVLAARVQHLVNHYVVENAYTFPDGAVWVRTK